MSIARSILDGVNRTERDAALLQELFTTGSLVNHLVVEELDAARVPSQDFSFLGWVRTLEPVTPGRLAEESGLPPTTIRDHVRRLVEAGKVRRVPNPADGRSYHLVLTPKGRQLMDRGWPAVVKAFLRLEPHLVRPAEEYVELVRELRGALKDSVASVPAAAVGSG
jgi:DNA-binding MarR family transcriptional regulator